jgi:hypothetical protein
MRYRGRRTVRFLLVHSPVVGPSTWRWVADALVRAGHEATVPDLVAAAVTGDPATLIQQAVVHCPPADDFVVVGHSGAGAILPAIAAGLPSGPRLLVFVDAGLPPCAGTFSVGGDFSGQLGELAIDGVLPIWSQWWSDGVLEALIPLDQRRHEIQAELPRVPLSFYEAVIEAPRDWCTIPSAYILLSEAYRQDAQRAAAGGWPVVERLGGHLDLVNDGDGIASILLDLVSGSGAARSRGRGDLAR